MADIRNDDLEDILAGMLDEQDRSNGRQSPAAKPPELPRRGAAAAPAASVPEDEDTELAEALAALWGETGGTRFPAGACRTPAYARRGCPEFCRPGL